MSFPKYQPQPQLITVGNFVPPLYYGPFAIYLSASEVINKMYKKFFNTKTWFSGSSIMGFDNENILEQFLYGVPFQPFKIQVDALSIFISKLDITNTKNGNSIQSGYQASVTSKFQKK
ncbi:hypothetical protein Glove_115g56 [Diversispora epigaea]|uniref:Uncharacterized protein n=1 Tax=Diversispora epigaea TaxID=1348612 RepID=A0A397JAE2_9GLOM|nr:hypothetical protein Glove_115g56 [Diversispora epigaea]